jgi:hypothetical protein
VVALVVAAIVGWVMWTNHRVWSDLDRAADDFGVPPGFTELQRVRSGDAFCFVTCTNGGEPVLTVVFDPGTLSIDETCDAVEEAVRESLDAAGSDLEPSLGFYECDFVGPLDGTMRIAGLVAQTEDLCTGCGDRWLDDQAVPDLPVVAWVAFHSGIE